MGRFSISCEYLAVHLIFLHLAGQTLIVMPQLNTWIIAPYKAPDWNLPDNEVFNNHVSMLRIRSEHAIGFLKGRFQSLKNLRLHIKHRVSHIIATYWVAVCIGIHAFAIPHEAMERRQEDPDVDELAPIYDPFIDEGLSSSSDSDLPQTNTTSHSQQGPARLQRAKARREKLKEKLFQSRLRRTQKPARWRRADVGAEAYSSVSDSEDE